MKKLLFLLFFISNAFAQNAVIFSGDGVRALKDKYKFKTSKSLESGSVDPTSVATPADIGSIYMRDNGSLYVKQDNGTTTNWELMSKASELNTHISDTTTHGTTGDIVGTTDTQTLTNKDIDGGTASNSLRLTLPSNTKTNLDSLTRKEGTIVWATDEDKLYLDDGTSLVTPSTSPSFTTVTKTSAATLSVTGEENVICDASGGSFSLTLPTASGNNGLTYKIHNLSNSNTCTIDANGAETIDGALTIAMSLNGDSMIIVSDGTNWKTVSDNIREISFYSSNSGSVSFSNATWTTMIYEDAHGDNTRSFQSIGTGEITVNLDGWYRFCYSVGFTHTSASGEESDIRLYKNATTQLGKSYIFYTGAATVTSTPSKCFIDYATTSDSYYVQVYQNSGGAISASTDSALNELTIERIK